MPAAGSGAAGAAGVPAAAVRPPPPLSLLEWPSTGASPPRGLALGLTRGQSQLDLTEPALGLAVHAAPGFAGALALTPPAPQQWTDAVPVPVVACPCAVSVSVYVPVPVPAQTELSHSAAAAAQARTGFCAPLGLARCLPEPEPGQCDPIGAARAHAWVGLKLSSHNT